MELSELRNRIDEIDRQLVDLFIRRMNTSAEVAEYKRQNGMQVLDASRERALLNKISELSGEEFEEYSRTLYSTILELSRSYQHKKLDGESTLYREITEALENTPKLFPERAVVACQGVEGAYSQIAAEKLFRAHERRKTPCHRIHCRKVRLVLLFAPLYIIPVAEHLFRGLGRDISENMGMALNKLFANTVCNIV